ncbi:GLPGLI family protein [Algibacter sp. PT7-4]|uniref:GLPGLI family protein n=1 Tax=Algibacter ulvanivorans TaxID=3400999 RepID=UPI003AACEEF6
MKINNNKRYAFILILLATISFQAQDFQGKAYYFSKTTMDMSRFNRGGEQMSEQRKKELQARLKSMLEKNYILTFNKEASIFKEEDKLSTPVSGSGRGPGGFASNFSPGPEYKNIKSRLYLQDQEFFGKQFLIKEELQPLAWVMETETKQIGQYLCFKATAKKVSTSIEFGPPRRGNNKTEAPKEENKEKETQKMIDVVAWYTPQIPVSQGPSDYWGLPGLILEVSAGNTTILCSKIIINPEEKTEIEAPKKGQEVTKQEYKDIITKKMEEFRSSRGRRSGRR